MVPILGVVILAVFLDAGFKWLPVTHVHYIPNMKPGSVCKITFAVFYNPSEFDRGVDYFFETLQISKAYVYTLYSV